jgi:hypothetical protein
LSANQKTRNAVAEQVVHLPFSTNGRPIASAAKESIRERMGRGQHKHVGQVVHLPMINAEQVVHLPMINAEQVVHLPSSYTNTPKPNRPTR